MLQNTSIACFVDLRTTKKEARQTGVHKHIVNVISELHNCKNVNLKMLCCESQLNNGKIPLNNILHEHDVISIPFNYDTVKQTWILLGRPQLDKYVPNNYIVYSPRNDYLPLKKRCSISTIHGFPELDPDYRYYKKSWLDAGKIKSYILHKKIVDRCQKIFVVSDFLKNKVRSLYNTKKDNIYVVGNGISNTFFKSCFKERVWPREYLMTVGGINHIDGGDNIITFAEILKDSNSHIDILVAGSYHDKKLVKMAKNLGNIHALGYIEEDSIKQYMCNSVALLYLTNYETFGLIGAEALALGVPIITKDITAVREILEDYPIYLQNVNKHSVLQSIMMCKNARIINQCKILASEMRDKFSWRSTAIRILNAIESD